MVWNDFKGSGRASEDENKEAKQNGSDEKRNGYTSPKFTSNDYQGEWDLGHRYSNQYNPWLH